MARVRVVLVVLGVALAAALTTCSLSSWSPSANTPGEVPLWLTQEPARVSLGDLDETMEQIVGVPVASGNRIVVLENGVEIFPAMLDAIRSAERSLRLVTFIYWQGDIAEEFANAIAERAGAGVAAHVLLDWWGSQKMKPALIETMREAGVEVAIFNPPKWWNPLKSNYRTHRKILIVDGATAFTGGVGIAEEWNGDARSPDEWRDLHFAVEGPVVAHLDRAFVENWNETVPDDARLAALDPGSLSPAGSVAAHGFESSPSEGADRIYHMYRTAIHSAQRDIRIVSAYFIPDDRITQDLAEAARRGVRVQIVVPGPHVDRPITMDASRAGWGPLLEAGVEIYEYQPTMLHTKLMVVDDYWVTIGSANFDNRSFSINDEANVNAYDRPTAAELIAVVERDVARSERITHAAWKNRPLTERLRELWTPLIRWQL